GTSNTMFMIETPRRKTSVNWGPFWTTHSYTNAIVPAYGINLIRPGTGDQYLYAFRAGSEHVGGAHALLGDGSVRFLSENMDQAILNALVSIANKSEVIVGEF